MSEILTLGLGNYGVLTAAHWANSTSKFDSEQRIIYSESSRRGAALRLFLLDEAQPSRVAKEVPLNTAPEELGRVPDHVKLRDDTEDGNADEEDQDEDELDFGWTWRTAKRHPRDELTAADREAEARHVDPSSEQAQPDAEDARVEVDDDDLLDEINGPPPQRLVPWWKYITAPTSRPTLVTQIHFDDPMGASLGHSFGFGYHQHWGGDMLTRAAGTLVGLDTYSDRLRRGIEDCDSAQGLQLFVDADSSYGGLACGLLQYLSEEFDDIRATVAHAIFPAVEFPASGDFVKKRRQEVLLNRALATAYLSQTAALYTPYEINSWSMPHLNKAFTIDDDVATSSIVAAASDTALYGARQRGTPQFRRLGETCALLRPGRAMSIVGVAHALPFPVPTPEVAPLRRGSTLDKSEVCLWSAFEASPLLKREPWRPLSFAFNQDVEVCQTSAGRIDAHYVAIRGTANLRDVRYPREEAMLRYAYPLRQLERFACSLFDEEYPVSSSFPVDRLFGAPRVSRLGPHGPMTAPAPAAVTVERDLTSFCAGTHLVNTTQAGGYLKQVCEGFDSTRYDREKLHQGYGFEKDEWAEVGETLHPLRDAYDRDGGLSDGDDGDDFE